MTTIKIFTKDENTVIEATAVNDAGTAYGVGDVTAVRMFRHGPRNDTTSYAAVTGSFTSEPTFQCTITGTLPFEGWWGFQFEYTLATSAKPVHTKIFTQYVGRTLVPA